MLNDKPQLITRQANSQASGVEIQQQALSLEADSRYEARVVTRLSVVGNKNYSKSTRRCTCHPAGYYLLRRVRINTRYMATAMELIGFILSVINHRCHGLFIRLAMGRISGDCVNPHMASI